MLLLKAYLFEMGINEWKLQVPGMVLAVINRYSRFLCSAS